MGCSGSKSTGTSSKSGPQGKQPFLVRLDYEFTDEEATNKALDVLRIAETFQPGHPGVIMYHFARPDPKNKPNFVEYTEVYANEATFWSHLAHPEINEAASTGMTDETTARNVNYAYGPGIQGKVKELCDNELSARQHGTLAGYVLHPESDFSGKEPIFLKFHVELEKEADDDLSKSLKSLAELTNPGVVVFHVTAPYQEDGKQDLELIEVCSSSSAAEEHLTSEDASKLIKNIVDNVKSVSCVAYGSPSSKITDKLKEVGVKVSETKTDVGFIIHPNVDVKSEK